MDVHLISVETLVDAVRAGLAELADPAKAPEMQRYMRSAMPFRGVQQPARRTLGKRLFRDHPLTDVASLQEAVRLLWDRAEYREERYLAVDLTGHRAYAAWQTVDLVPMYEKLIVTGAWWDFVDEIAIRRIGPILRAQPAQLTPIMRDWANHADRWKRRTAVICQIKSRAETDTDLLADCIEANIADPDFFLRKGIGWALREHAKTDPDRVRTFVADNPGLSPLSVREALKHFR